MTLSRPTRRRLKGCCWYYQLNVTTFQYVVWKNGILPRKCTVQSGRYQHKRTVYIVVRHITDGRASTIRTRERLVFAPLCLIMPRSVVWSGLAWSPCSVSNPRPVFRPYLPRYHVDQSAIRTVNQRYRIRTAQNPRRIVSDGAKEG